MRLSGRGCSASIFIPLQPFSFKYWPPNPQFLLPIPHLRPLSADPSPLIRAKFISRDWQSSLKGKADWMELSSLAIFLPISGGNRQLSVSAQPLAGIPADKCCVSGRGKKKIMAPHLKTPERSSSMALLTLRVFERKPSAVLFPLIGLQMSLQRD